MIYCFGNSHAHFFTNTHPGILGWGGITQYFRSYSGNFHNPQYRHVLVHKFTERFFPYFINVINSLNITENDYIIFIVGEIDCRWGFPKKIATQNRHILDVLKEELEYFFPSFIQLKESGYNVLGWGGHPSTIKSGNNDENNNPKDPDNPIYGDCKIRNEISITWSDLLEKKCKDNNIKFISIVRDLINLDGLTKMEYYYDDYHLKPSVMPIVIEKCKKEGVIC